MADFFALVSKSENLTLLNNSAKCGIPALLASLELWRIGQDLTGLTI